MDALQELLETHAIAQLKARYFRTLDYKLWDDWLALFTEDATLEFDLTLSPQAEESRESHKLTGREAIADYVVAHMDPVRSVHQGHAAEIEILSDTEARAVWPMEDILVSPGSFYKGYGHYHETYRKQDGQWRIASSHLTKLYSETTVNGRVLVP